MEFKIPSPSISVSDLSPIPSPSVSQNSSGSFGNASIKSSPFRISDKIKNKKNKKKIFKKNNLKKIMKLKKLI